MQRVAIDMDEVIADTMGHYLSLYNADFSRNLTVKQLHGKRVLEVIEPEHRERARGYFATASFFEGIPVMPGSQEVVEALSKQYEVFVTTAAMDVPCSFAAKFEWLGKYFPFIPPSHVVFCGDKSIVYADYLIDDDVRHFRRFGGEGILYTAPHNVAETSYRRVDNWDEVRRLLLN